MKKTTLIKEGKAKRLYNTDEADVVWVEYLDQATALNGKRKDRVIGKGALDNQIDCILFDIWMQKGFIRTLLKKFPIPNN